MRSCESCPLVQICNTNVRNADTRIEDIQHRAGENFSDVPSTIENIFTQIEEAIDEDGRVQIGELEQRKDLFGRAKLALNVYCIKGPEKKADGTIECTNPKAPDIRRIFKQIPPME